jgi:hypothetical protein
MEINLFFLASAAEKKSVFLFAHPTAFGFITK